jgi:hypothetical protein
VRSLTVNAVGATYAVFMGSFKKSRFYAVHGLELQAQFTLHSRRSIALSIHFSLAAWRVPCISSSAPWLSSRAHNVTNLPSVDKVLQCFLDDVVYLSTEFISDSGLFDGQMQTKCSKNFKMSPYKNDCEFGAIGAKALRVRSIQKLQTTRTVLCFLIEFFNTVSSFHFLLNI